MGIAQVLHIDLCPPATKQLTWPGVFIYGGSVGSMAFELRRCGHFALHSFARWKVGASCLVAVEPVDRRRDKAGKSGGGTAFPQCTSILAAAALTVRGCCIISGSRSG